MKLKNVIALYTGGLAYIITVLISLILGLPVKTVLIKGVLAFILLLIFSWLAVSVLEIFADNKENEKMAGQGESESSEPEDREEMGKIDKEKGDGGVEEEFSPLNPPVLEVEEGDNSQEA